jgi:hypothetical protein
VVLRARKWGQKEVAATQHSAFCRLCISLFVHAVTAMHAQMNLKKTELCISDHAAYCALHHASSRETNSSWPGRKQRRICCWPLAYDLRSVIKAPGHLLAAKCLCRRPRDYAAHTQLLASVDAVSPQVCCDA